MRSTSERILCIFFVALTSVISVLLNAQTLFADSPDSTATKDTTTLIIAAGSSTDLVIMLALIAFLILALFLMRSAMRSANPPI